MRFSGDFEGTAQPSEAQARLRDVSQWSWVSADQIAPAPGGCTLGFDGPVPVRIRIEVDPTEDGARLRLVEGDLADLTGEISVTATESGCRVRVTLDLAFGVSVPGTLLRQLDQRLLPAWSQALADAPAA